jgi:coenzyme F420-reducing hydrogenase alpha subunit
MTTKPVNMDINVHHVTRVEGHGNIVVDIKDGQLEKCYFNVVEAPRFFESFLRGRNYTESALITSRICGICSPGHQLTSLKATEKAMGIQPSEQTIILRKILADAATLQSHILHVYFLAAPDLLSVPSVIPLVATHPDVVKRALRLKKLANDICDVVGGRSVHPNRMIPGGVTMVPTVCELKELQKRLKDAVPDILATVETVKSLAGNLPDFTRETEYISLKSKEEYAIYDGDIFSSDTGATKVDNYKKMTNEKIVEHSSAKHTSANRSSFMVGALARCNNNSDMLNETAKIAAKELGFKAPCYNPFFNNVAQVIEAGLVVQRMIEYIDKLIQMGPKEEPRPKIKVKAGQGVGCTEVPRGILYHDYTYDENGTVIGANCIIPTNQNFSNIDDDMRKMVPELVDAGKSRDEITFALEVLVRAYDPCISCSVHFLKVRFK